MFSDIYVVSIFRVEEYGKQISPRAVPTRAPLVSSLAYYWILKIEATRCIETGGLSPDYTASHSRRQNSSQLQLCEPQALLYNTFKPFQMILLLALTVLRK
jgi:hypothetical protein